VNGIDLTTFLLLLAFNAYLAALIVTVYLLRGSTESSVQHEHSPSSSSPHQDQNPSFSMDVPVDHYRHSLTVSSEDIAQKLTVLLSKQDITPMLVREKRSLHLRFDAKKRLQNAEALKKKGVIIDYTIDEVC